MIGFVRSRIGGHLERESEMEPTEDLRVDAFVSGQYAGQQGVASVDECPFGNRIYRFWWQCGMSTGYVTRAAMELMANTMRGVLSQ